MSCHILGLDWLNLKSLTDHIPLAGQGVDCHEVCSEGCGHDLWSPAL